ncbi:jg22565 [Pararge aegeria aegeria]|uniref:Jg22565 protein n=2 Tax=Pararge aegeria TaxID=116150 RepID=A0A8S4SLG9_9NEOP|nr:jg22565 [Pararge aegeria aegeria]
MKKWRQMRDAWVRTLKDKKNCKTSGSAVSNTKPYKYHNQMLFLKKVVAAGETHESVSAKQTKEHTEDDTTTSNEPTNEDDSVTTMTQLDNDSQKDKQNLAPPPKRRAPAKRNFNEIDAKMMSYIDYQIKPKKIEQDDRNLSFFKGILPSLALLDDDQTLEFQSGVLNLLQNIKHRRIGQSTYDWSAYTQTSGASHYQSQGYFSRPQPTDSALSPVQPVYSDASRPQSTDSALSPLQSVYSDATLDLSEF